MINFAKIFLKNFSENVKSLSIYSPYAKKKKR